MKNILLLLTCFLSTSSNAQSERDTIEVLAKYINSIPGYNYNYGTYQVICIVSGHLNERVIYPAYIPNLEFVEKQDTVLLKMVCNFDQTKPVMYYNFPNYDAKNNIKKVKTFVIDHDFLEGCETGQGFCDPKTFTRDFAGQKAFIIMPCGGSFSTVQLHHKSTPSPIQELSVKINECPPFFDVSALEDGEYSASMMSCGLGGGFKLQLKSNFAKTQSLSGKINCDCTSYSEIDPKYTWNQKYSVLPEEVTQVPALSETWVNYLSDYDLEKDSLGRVSKMIRTNHNDNTTEITNYIYDTQNRLVREDIHEESNTEQYQIYRKERIDFYYDENGRRVKKIRTVLGDSRSEFVTEECTYFYNQ